MQTFTEPRAPVVNPSFASQRDAALAGLDLEALDCPLVDLVQRLTRVPWCFPMESCCGHFVVLSDGTRRVLDRLPTLVESPSSVLYRVAYLALCVDATDGGADLLRDLHAVPSIAPELVQFGCASSLWDRQPNTFVLQVVPWTHRYVDDVMLSYDDAVRVEEARSWFFARLDDLVREQVERADTARSIAHSRTGREMG